MNTLIKKGETYLTSTGYDKIIMYGNFIEEVGHSPIPNIDIKIGEFDLDTKELATKVINLGKKILNYIDDNLQNTYIDFINHDFLKQWLIDYDIKNNFVIKKLIIEWYKENIYPFNDLNNDEYTFATLCIRLYAILKCYNRTITRKDSPSASTLTGKHKNNLYFIFNDYIIENMNENDYNKYTLQNKKINHKIDDDVILKYINKLFNDINKRYDIWHFNKALVLNKEKRNVIISYHVSPISAVYDLIAKLLCDKNEHIKECRYCGYYMKVDNLHKEYHDKCHKIVDLNRKKNDRT